jgi:methionyl-tRNA formyltransferase
MRIALFTSGGAFGMEALRALSERQEVVLVVQPGVESLRAALRPIAVWAGLKQKYPLEKAIEQMKIPRLLASTGSDPKVSRILKTSRADIICIAAYRWVLDPATYSLPEFGAINVHPSLLPRHRGRVPLFWVYYQDDRLSGVTVHRVSEQADAGPVLLQRSFDVPRGWPVDEMHERCAQLGAGLLAEACTQIETRAAVYVEQDHSTATSAPKVPAGTRMIDFSLWPTERVWHFIAGLSTQYREPLLDPRNGVVRYRRATGFQTGVKVGVEPGVAVVVANGWLLQCRDGVVELTDNAAPTR